MMLLVTDIKQISEFRNKVKSHSGKVLMNYFIAPQEMLNLIQEGKVEYAEYPGCVLMVVRYPYGDRLIYFAGSNDLLEDAVNKILPDLNPNTILEDMDRKPEPELPFNQVMTLQYMVRMGAPVYSAVSASVVIPANEQLEEIEEILKSNFNPIWERVPNSIELNEILSDDNIRIFFDGTDIQGVLVYENDTKSSHLRYWLTLPNARGKGVGSALMNAFFEKGASSTSQHLWVDINNQNAIKRYEHYGFKLNPRYDHIYQIK